jgi:CDP-6-deoxy-D-xylo-4-hexulose-3-dehydrase
MIDDQAVLKSKIFDLVDEYFERFHDPLGNHEKKLSAPVSGRVYSSDELIAAVDSALDFWLTAGPKAARFEKKLSKKLNCRYSLFVNSGSSANLLALSSLTTHFLGDRKLNPGDEVITCATGFPTTINPILQNNLVPVFVDPEMGTYNPSFDSIANAVTEKTRAISIAHTLGNPFEAARIFNFARDNNLFLLSDCCDALGARYNGKPLGEFSDLATLSFYPAHHITTGEGGAVGINSSIVKRSAESVRDWGRDCWCEPGADNTCNKRYDWKFKNLPAGTDHKYIYSTLGYNLKATDLQAAIGLSQLKKLDAFVANRKENFQTIYAEIKKFEDKIILPQSDPLADPSWFGFPITIRTKKEGIREKILRNLNHKNIGTRLLFGGNLLRQPYMDGREYRISGALRNSDQILGSSFWVGVYPGLTKQRLEYLISNLITELSKI